MKVNSEIFDHTNAGGTWYSTRLNGSANERTGLAKSLSVMPALPAEAQRRWGDVVNAEVYVKYLDPNSSNWTAAMNSLITSIANGTAPANTFIDGGSPGSTGGVTAPHLGALNKSGETGTAPKAYLNYIIFGRDYIIKDGGFVRVTTAAREYGQDGAHEKLSASITVSEPGYIYLYLSNDNVSLGGGQVEVYWDDFKVEHIKSPVISTRDYYPFGLTFNSYSRENSLNNPYQYNGKEMQDELSLGWLDYGARMYDASISRWMAIDPLAAKYLGQSPYNYVANIPTILIDPNGMEIDWSYVTKDEKKAIKRGLREHNSSSTYRNLYRQLRRSENRYVILTTYNFKDAGLFQANTNSKITTENESTGQTETHDFQNPATKYYFGKDEKGGTLTVNMELTGKDPSAIADLLVEEVVHASQYENSVGKNKAVTNEQGLPATANTEFEAKSIVGQIQRESNRPLWSAGADKVANDFGRQAFQSGSTSGYSGALQQWHSNPSLNPVYRARPITGAQPSLLQKLIK